MLDYYFLSPHEFPPLISPSEHDSTQDPYVLSILKIDGKRHPQNHITWWLDMILLFLRLWFSLQTSSPIFEEKNYLISSHPHPLEENLLLTVTQERWNKKRRIESKRIPADWVSRHHRHSISSSQLNIFLTFSLSLPLIWAHNTFLDTLLLSGGTFKPQADGTSSKGDDDNSEENSSDDDDCLIEMMPSLQIDYVSLWIRFSGKDIKTSEMMVLYEWRAGRSGESGKS